MKTNNQIRDRKKKIAKIVPICVISTGFLVGLVNPAFAKTTESKLSSQQTIHDQGIKSTSLATSNDNINLYHIGDDLNQRIYDAVKNRPDLFVYHHVKGESGRNEKISDMDKSLTNGYIVVMNNLKYPGVTINNGYNIDWNQREYVGGDIKVTGKQDSVDGLHSFTLGTFHNTENIEQIATTQKESYQTTDSFTYSTSKGVKLGLTESLKATAGVPLIVNGEETTTLSTEFSYNQTSSNTATNSHTIEFPSQTIKVKPHGTTIYIGEVKQLKFSGDYSGTTKLTTQDVSFPIVDSEGHWGDVIAAPGEKEHFLYNIFKYSGHSIPADIRLDDASKTVAVDNSSIHFTGKLGFNMEATWKFIPDDPQKPAVTIPHDVYMKEQASGNISKYIDQLILNKTQAK
ncbi:hypothetical protein CN448_31410 [Bacillus cereus]|uniref:ETX/MTX2 family pore-forming toxin n=1 Tax=Bacillus cereus TaxID=1396 RepID=UPI000BF4A935|nr:ETX/MTX2 family pore-forming toxin [Bacillus cereus]PEW59099.1 hypothetical protein CN448_31410 [Bacillus cereus]